MKNLNFHCRIDTVKQFIQSNLSWGREIMPHYEEYFDLEAMD